MSDDTTRTRFLTAIAAQLPVDRVVEMHLFGPIRQGGAESGVAVIAVDPDEAALPADGLEEAGVLPDAPVTAAEASDDSAYAPAPPVDLATDRTPVSRHSARRYTVYTARYRHTLKGPDRGRWEASVTEEADAPLRTVDAVVRGVSRRSGEADETIRLSGDEFRAALPVPAPIVPSTSGPLPARALHG
jgi:hypothetical protein